MNNKAIASIFFKLADILESKGIEWKPQAYRKAARALLTIKEDVLTIYKSGGLKALDTIPGVGEGIAKKIAEYLEKGKIKEYEKLKPLCVDLTELSNIQSIGPKKARKLYEDLGIKTIAGLKRAASKGEIAGLEGFGEKSQQDILDALKFRKKTERVPLKKVLPIANKIKRRISNLNETERFELAGSIRRRKAAIRDIDSLAVSKKPEVLIEAFTSMPDVQKVLAKGPTKAIVMLRGGMQADLRVVKPESFGAAFLYFTGPKEYNIWMRKIAMQKGYKLSEYGLFNRKTGKLVEGRNEKKIFKILGIKYLPPDKREDKVKWDAVQG